MEVFAKWAKTPEAKKAVEAAKSKAWKNFLAKFPNADKSKFEAQVYFEKDHTAKAEIYFKRSRFSDECFWLRQQILEPGNESRSRKTERVPSKAVLLIFANSSGEFWQHCLRFEENIQ